MSEISVQSVPSVGLSVPVMESQVCETCGRRFVTTKARNMHEVHMHGKSARRVVNVGKYYLWLLFLVVRLLYLSGSCILNS